MTQLVDALLLQSLGAGVALLAVYLTNKNQLRRLEIQLGSDKTEKSSQLRREKVETLYLDASKWIKYVYFVFLETASAMDGKRELKDIDSAHLDREKKQIEFDPDRIRMIVHLYFPEALQAYEALEVSRNRLAMVMADFRREYYDALEQGRRIDGKKNLSQFLTDLKVFDACGERFLKKVSDIANL